MYLDINVFVLKQFKHIMQNTIGIESTHALIGKFSPNKNQ